ncbi:translation initiation factor eIF-2B subunit gamma [Saitoella complicata NRRL Y-17804]|uniref:translation initiation factor eIF-2B subunit gamma n=1 Tax=Saitoella complicata (strain BCRC 22490 / CBS 7301 / JCM 7358 / NBRC 10748 / NRRL Y-17804) TaxID=698492 RepID=UPI000866EB57|nr:translation initiation factor eIF-2B subunit gamma [Saitoella complicata NRRL Y-17804]ODQ56202.1 translation initiation factor eIF-2B subunit gamma [Saitoella complicata NRRL Y-17804]
MNSFAALQESDTPAAALSRQRWNTNTTSAVSHELTAIIMAGYGNSLYPLTEESNLPKALLPVANRPMLWYPLQWCEKAGFGNVMVVCQTEAEDKIAAWLKYKYEGKIKVNLEAPSNAEETAGTADVLRILKDKIKSDFVVLSTDQVMDMQPYALLDFHRIHSPTVTSVYYTPVGDAAPKDTENMLYVGYDDQKKRLLYVKAEADVEDELEVRMSLLWKYPRLRVSTKLQDAHVYIFKRWVLDLIARNDKISSIKGDLMPLLAKAQYQSLLVEKVGMAELTRTNSPPLLPTQQNTTHSLGNDYAGNPIKISLLVYPKNDFCARANTPASYAELNRHLAKQNGETLGDARIAGSADVSLKAQVGTDSLVGEHSKVDERTSLKRSIIGQHCVVGRNVKISNSIIMDRVVIEDGAKIEGCTVCTNVRIGSKAQLTNCEVGGGFVVEEGFQAKGEKLVDFRDMEMDSDSD